LNPSVVKKLNSAIASWGGIEVLEKFQLLLESRGNSVEWPLTVLTEAYWLPLSKDQKMQILDNLEKKKYDKPTQEMSTAVIKINSGK
jgi:hypothetical protein